jgi:hypothetical protein
VIARALEDVENLESSGTDARDPAAMKNGVGKSAVTVMLALDMIF